MKKSDARQVLSENLRLLIERVGSGLRLGKGTGVPQRTISRAVNNENAVSLDTVNTLAQGLGIEPWQLLAPNLGLSPQPKDPLSVDLKAERSIDRVLLLAAMKGWDQSELANQLGVLPQHITNWKARGIPPEHLPKLADLFGKTVDDLLGRQSSDGGGALSPEQWQAIKDYCDQREVALIEHLNECQLRGFCGFTVPKRPSVPSGRA